MGHLPLLNELAAIAALGVLVTAVLARLRLPAVAGLLLAGVLAGPAGFGIVTSQSAIRGLAELGVVLLLFTIGLEFSLDRLKDVFQRAALGGALQVVLTGAATAGAALLLGQPASRAVFFGFVFALSSTAIVLRALAERREVDAPHGRFIVGTLVFQDLCVLPMVVVLPLLAGRDDGGALNAVAALVRAAVVVIVVLVAAKLLVPRLLTWVDRSRSREVFLLAVLALCIGTGWLTSLVGLPLALGAFVGGLAVADTRYGHRAMSEVLPLRDTFLSVFFVSLGMLFDAQRVLSEPLVVLGLAAAFVIGKGLLATAVALVMRFPPRVAWLAGVGLAQFGEFGFVLAQVGEDLGVVDGESLAPVFSAGILSMFLTPLLVRAAPRVTAGERLLAPLAKLLGARSIAEAPAPKTRGHVVVVGYGLSGRLLTKAIEACGTRTVALELNAETVREASAAGAQVFYGDATSEEALRHAYLEEARALVLVLNDPPAAQRIIDTARRVAPQVPVILRARYLAEAPGLRALGATDVVAEEVEGAVEMLVRVLRWLEVPRNVIEQRVHDAREATQTSHRRMTMPRRTIGELQVLADLKLEHFAVEAGSAAEGHSPVSLNLRRGTGALAIAVQRGPTLLEKPDAVVFQPGDVVFLVGPREAINRAERVMKGPKAAPVPGE